MADIIIASTTFDGTPLSNPTHPYKPTKLTFQIEKIGRLLRGKDGTRTWMHRAHKHTFVVTWAEAHQATLNATRTIFLLTAPFTYVNEFGGSFTVITTGEDDYTEEFAFTSGAGVNYYNLELTLREV